jgi:hypothetical protein
METASPASRSQLGRLLWLSVGAEFVTITASLSDVGLERPEP